MSVTAVATASGRSLEVRIATAAMATAAALLLDRGAALTVRVAASAATAVAASRLRCSRACDRQCGNARGEEEPGHGISPFERNKTARKPHRSNA
jgi:hypothetical protein